MRIVAGPNGSGKTTVFRKISNDVRIPLGVYVNADDIEAEMRKNRKLDFGAYQLVVVESEVQDFIRESGFSAVKRNEPYLFQKLTISNNCLIPKTKIDSYLAADIAEFIRQMLLRDGKSFTYETVMSHEKKIEFIENAKAAGYRVYLYFFATSDPQINVNRIQLRVKQDGHDVSESIVYQRYERSLAQLKKAVKLTSRAYVFDNSGDHANWIAEVENGTQVKLNDSVDLPEWVERYLFES